MMYRSQPCLAFFSSVVKNVASPNIEIKKLVYIYLLSHAEQDQSLALLSINTIQKSLSDGNPQVRTLALKTMSGIRVPAISRIVSLAIKKGIGDMSPLVRKTAAFAIAKCYRLDPNTLAELMGYLSCLLGDKQCSVTGAAVKVFNEVCPDQIDLIHKHYRGLVKSLVEMDEWSQLATLKLLTIYSRKCFPKLSRKTTTKSNKNQKFSGDDNECGLDKFENKNLEAENLDPDLKLLLNSIKPLLHSRNSAIIVAVARCYINLGTQEYIDASIGPLVALLRGPQDIQTIALHNIFFVCIMRPEPFVKYVSHFLIHTTDSSQIWRLKLELLSLTFPYCSAHLKNFILNELEHFSQGSSDGDLVRKAVQAIGRCAQSDSKTCLRCIRILLRHVTSIDVHLVEESVLVLRHLIQQDPGSHTETIIWLAKNLDSISNPIARASIIWLVGESHGINNGNGIAADVLRILAKNFADEAEASKLQIILLAAKVYLHYLNCMELNKSKYKPENEVLENIPQVSDNEGFEDLDKDNSPPGLNSEHPIVALWNYIILLARFDTSYDLRDRVRLCKSLLDNPSSINLACLMLLASKPAPRILSPSENRKLFTLGSASQIVSEGEGLRGIRGYEPLPDWVLPGNEPNPSLRDVQVVKSDYASAGERLDSAVQDARYSSPSRPHGIGSVAHSNMTLDGWLAEGEDKIDEDEENYNEEEDEDDEEDYEEDDSEEEEDESAEDDESEEDDKSEASCSQLLMCEEKMTTDDKKE